MLITKAQVIAQMPVEVEKLTAQLNGYLGIYKCLLDKRPAQAIERLGNVKRGLNATSFGGCPRGCRDRMPSGLLDVISSAIHTYIHTYIHAYTDTRTHGHTRTHTHPDTHAP